MYRDQETLGQYLKRERESHRVPVEEIALFVGVNRSFIDSLEGDEFCVFAGRSECARLVKRYSAYLKLNQTETLRLFDAQWKLTGGAKRYPKLTQFADGDFSPGTVTIFNTTRFLIGRLPITRVWLAVVLGALIGTSVLLTDFFETKQGITPPDEQTPSDTAIGGVPDRNHVSPPAANPEVKTASPKSVSPTEVLHPRPDGAEAKKTPHANGIKVIGNRDSKRYHLPGMKYYDRVKVYHRVVFESEKEAIRAGYRKARE